jgi:twitching motility protein PilU
MDITPYLKLMVQKDASDLFFSTGAPVHIKMEGVATPLSKTPLPPGAVKDAAYKLLSESQIDSFESEMELDTAVSLKDTGRFRVNLFRQRGEVAMVVRYIRWDIPSIEELNLPVLLKQLALESRGLVVVVGATGSGKSTTLASMVSFRSKTRSGHILTIEDPIEFIHRHAKSIVNQREIGLDTRSYAAALRRAVREAPDVIMIGEIRDKETMQQALAYANSGHLCLTTLHSTNADQALERILNLFPAGSQQQIMMDLSLNMRAIVAQRLLIGVDGKRIPAVEVLLDSPYVRKLIREGEIHKLKQVMEENVHMGMQTFDNALANMCKRGLISREEAVAGADDPSFVQLKMGLGGISISPEPEETFY